ncbi:MAG: PilZ domain-containing protein, partial [Proteobacteria bacterium]|nr:PilZ domain-containing protein [Pseudomonadota bacterium]
TSGTRGNRVPLKANLECIGAFDLIRAKAVNVSGTGISFKTAAELPFEMRYTHNGETVSRTAHLIWVKHTEKGGYYFGLQFIDEKALPQF